jgi:SAM-dependent MidA family methyltransferase
MQAGAPPDLPTPDAASAEHSKRVAAHLRQTIAAAGGLISFAEFMQHALYAPGLGYYSAGSTKFGAAGDFVTAPEVSPLFGRVIARQIASTLESIEAPEILEIGAGSGRLAADILAKLAELDALPASYRILEVSADLRDRQQQWLEREIPEFAERVSWLDRLPRGHRGVIVANEVLDALPVERFRRTGTGIEQVCVSVAGADFCLQLRPAGELLATAVQAIEQDIGQRLPVGYESEVCLAAPAWTADVATALAEGIMLLFDYGVSRREYYGPERSGGWLRCHFRHHAHDNPLILPGIQDLTAWVDFTSVATAATNQGLGVTGYVSQAQFLLHGGLADELGQLAELPPAAQLELSAQVKTLTLPGEMGEHFKCLGLSRGSVTAPAAFAGGDRAASL